MNRSYGWRDWPGLHAWFVLGVIGLSGCTSTSTKLVTIRSVVDRSYLSERADRPATAGPETFILTKGRRFTGAGDFSELEKMDFSAIARTLKGDLTRSGYLPSDNGRTADLVIVVHWGVTGVVERPADLFAYDPDAMRQAQDALVEAKAKAIADAGTPQALNSAGAVAAAEAALRAETNHAGTMYSGNDLQADSNADLLGFREVLQASSDTAVHSNAVETLREMVNEERYFAVLVAYDGRAARQGQRRRLWTTRMSIGASGQSFSTGLDRMSNTAATSHGRPQVGIMITPTVERGTAAPMPAPAK